MQQYNNYWNQRQNDLIQALQQQIASAQAQLQSLQSYQQMAQPQPQQSVQMTAPVQQAPVQTQPTGVTTRIVQDFESISANDVPMDNNGALFVKSDGSEIQLRRWGADGRITVAPYKPVIAENSGENENTENSTAVTQKMEIGLSDEATAAFMKRFDDLSGKIERLEKSIKPTTAKGKKEADEA